jgi:hypothetical protein
MAEMRHTLRDDGLLLLAVPTCRHDTLIYPKHRIYGPKRLHKLLSGFRLVGRVWDGEVVRGGLSNATHPPTLWQPNCVMWQHQQVLVLAKAPRGGKS